MMLMRVSGKDGFRHHHHGPCGERCAHQLIDKQTLTRILRRVDEQRLDAAVQELYNQQDDLGHFARVTEQLYRTAIGDEGVEDVDKALECVFSVRSSWQQKYDEEMQAVLQDLIHVKYDLTPPEREDISPSRDQPLGVPESLLLHDLDSEDVTSLASMCSGLKPLVLLAGSWS